VTSLNGRMTVGKDKRARTPGALLAASLLAAVASPAGLALPTAHAAGPTVLKDDHADVGIAYEDGAWNLHVHQEAKDIEYEAGSVLLHLPPATKTASPNDARFTDCLGAPGTATWILPQVEQTGVLFLGLATEEIADGVFTGNAINLALTSKTGPGEFCLYQTDGFGAPTTWFNTRNGISGADRVSLPTGQHSHANWTFSAPGVYQIGLEASGTLVADSSATSSGTVLYTFYVEDGAAPVSATKNLDSAGGSLAAAGVTVNLPADALATATALTLSVGNSGPAGVMPPGGTRLLNRTATLAGPTGAFLRRGVSVTLTPTADELAAAGSAEALGMALVRDGMAWSLPVTRAGGTLQATVDSFGVLALTAATDAGSTISGPAPADPASYSPLLKWASVPGAKWFHVQVVPFNQDGPAIDLMVGDPALVGAAQYRVQSPAFGAPEPNYVLLPGMTYLWRVRVSPAAEQPGEADWSAWSTSWFKTPGATAAGITLKSPAAGTMVANRRPTLEWTNTDTAVFYYEVQVSKDSGFGSASFLYSELVHGGVGTPRNSYAIPPAFPLEANTTYFWRVRPRLQGDAVTAAWPPAASFKTPAQ